MQPTRTASIFALLLLPLLSTATAQTLVNGTSVTGAISVPGEVDTWFFNVAAGDSLTVRAAANFPPSLKVFDPFGQQIGLSETTKVVTFSASNATAGLYSLSLAKWTASARTTGPYEIHFASVPGANELGALPPGGSVASSLDIGDLDTFTFDLAAGEGYMLRLAELPGATTVPRLIIYDPVGAVVSDTSKSVVASASGTAALAGNYTALVLDNRFSSLGQNGQGPYELQFLRSQGPTEFGSIGAEGEVFGDLTVGDLDSFSLSLNAGDSYLLRLAELPGSAFAPALTLYGPDGAFISAATSTAVSTIGGIASLTGNHTLVVSDASGYSSGNDGTGPYVVRWITVPGANENGVLTDGTAVADDIPIGDLDSWTFLANAGTPIQITAAEIGNPSLRPTITVYGPDGTFLVADNDRSVASVSFSTLASGIHTVLVSDGSGFSSGANGTGGYNLTFTGAVMVPTLSPNQILPAASPSDPTLTDIGGDPLGGPRIGDGSEPINFELNCSQSAGAGFYVIQVSESFFAVPMPTPFGDLHASGAALIQTAGIASGSVETLFPPPGFTLPNNSALVGLTYAAQGFCGEFSSASRLSNGVVQVVGL